jgi:hypothetical protein
MALHHDLINIFHLSRTALAGTPKAQSGVDRMLWAAAEFSKANPAISQNRAYKELSRMRDNGNYTPNFSNFTK